MRHRLVPAVWALALSLGLVGLAGCGSSSTPPPPPPPSITSFAASPAAIEVGSSAALTAVFTNGTGMVMPGSLPITSGTAITVNPAATTTYTLTVTPTSGTAVTATTAITVTPAPVITSFMASPVTIEAGTSTSLTAVFTGGTGVITPGNIAVTTGTAVSVSPTATTTYTLTVTPPVGAAITATTQVTVDPIPAIISFTANPSTINAGSTTSLTASFTGGTGVISPGNIAVTTGTAVSVSPTATTTYTLTVTPPVGTAVTSTVTVTVNPILGITSFVASPSTITVGSASSLTAVFTGGTGVITPGNLPVTSGVAVSVTPTITTTYTVTVTPTTGSPIAQALIVTVDPAPKISSFVASPNSIAAGASTILTGVFSYGTGVITPGNLPATSGMPVTVSPTITTTYTLTVTSTTGSAVTATATAIVTVAAVTPSTVTVNTTPTSLPVTDQLLGMNLAAWYDVTSTTDEPAIQQGFATAGIKAIRWPGGSWSDEYNWETNTECGNYANTNDDFTDIVNKLVVLTGVDLALTADYGTGKNCTGPGDPTEAAAWATEALNLGVTVSHMTVGNEEYGSWEYDNHTLKNNAATYAAAVAGTNGYYDLIKTASPKTLVGVDVNPGNYPAWDPTVLSGAPYDFVEFHYYPETPGSESDTFLVHQAAQALTNDINTIKSELQTAGKPNTPIYVGEIGGPYSNPGKQSWSITQGLYAGQVLGEMMNDGVSRLTWWIGFGNCNGQSGNNSASVYGWQDFGAYNVFSDGPSDSSCPGAGPAGTLSPTARAFELFSQVAVTGESVLTSTVSGDKTDVRAYAATNSSGAATAVVVFNLNETVSEPITITLSGKTTATSVTQTTYDKAIYDQSGPSGNPANPLGTDTWAAPTTTTLGAQSLPLSITLTPWSMNVFIIK